MRRLPIRPIRTFFPIFPALLLALVALIAAPLTAHAAAQSIPDNIPDLPGESPADRAKERLVESHRGFLSRLFTTGSFDAAPLLRDGMAYQSNFSFGLDFRSGDAVFLAISGRMLPDRDPLAIGEDPWVV